MGFPPLPMYIPDTGTFPPPKENMVPGTVMPPEGKIVGIPPTSTTK